MPCWKQLNAELAQSRSPMWWKRSSPPTIWPRSLEELQEELKATKRQRIRDIDEAPGSGGASGGDL